jgi:nuclear pore complex protein Nup155
MGGYDGSLYEMSYEGFFSPNQRQGDWYEDYGSDLNGNTHSRTSMTSALAAGSKRVISTLVFGPSTPNQRPRKCRKINHTTVAPPLVESFVPGFVLRTASALFSTSSTVNGGPIVNLSMDTDRDTLYALTSKGYIHAFDLNGIGANAQLTEGVAKSAPPPRLACSMNVVKSVRKYLDSVARGRMYPPMASADATVANIRFPGGGTGAQAGVGGMDGARSLLKVADTETMRVNTKKKNARGSPDDSVFSPMSIHVVPLSESSCLTLVAILAGGLRLYLSVLPDAGTRKSGVSVRPGRNFTLCHVRAPPPFNVHGKKLTLKNKEVLSNGFAPGVGSASLNSRKGCYSSSATIMAIGCGNQAASSDKSSDTIVALTPDYCYRSERSEGVNSKASNFSLATYNESDGSGISEMISLPMAKQSASGDGDSFVPGGHIWDIVSVSHYSTSSVSSSFFLSSTPHDSELCEDVIPAFVHSSKKIRSGFNRANYVAGKSNSSDPFADVQRGSLLSMTLDAVGNVMFGRPKRTGRVNSAISNLPRQPMYRILDHARCKNVFSISQNLNSRQSRYSRRTNDTSQPHRLPSWLLSPAKIPLPELSSQHLGKDVLTKRFIALNSGGLHIFTHISPLEKLRDVLLKSNTSNIARDQNVKSFFVSYGHREACSMCLAVAINIDSEAVARKAMQAALSFSNRPSMYHTLGNGSNNLVTSSTLEDCTIDHPYGHEGYSFKPSSLHDGLVVLISRILRPVWCKAPVVVREGKGTKSKHSTGQERKPALVELFLDDSTSDDIRKPLIRLQVLMREMFPPAISVIPGAPSSDSDAMEITETIGEGSLLTRAIQYQTQASTSTHAHSEKELRSIAHLSEERSLHSLYRLVSRSAQLLSLLSHLRRAHVTPELPEVDFGLLHGE